MKKQTKTKIKKTKAKKNTEKNFESVEWSQAARKPVDPRASLTSTSSIYMNKSLVSKINEKNKGYVDVSVDRKQKLVKFIFSDKKGPNTRKITFTAFSQTVNIAPPLRFMELEPPIKSKNINYEIVKGGVIFDLKEVSK